MGDPEGREFASDLAWPLPLPLLKVFLSACLSATIAETSACSGRHNHGLTVIEQRTHTQS